MSYSFGVKAANKAAAKEAVAAKVAEIVAQQPIHARDSAIIVANASAAIDLLADDDTKDIAVSCNGYLSWSAVGNWSTESAPIGSASVGCSANHAARD